MLDFIQLTTFRAIAVEGSFSRAATLLNYAQSSVTAQIRTLESTLGVPLFDRLGRRVELTAAGRRLLGYADRILTLVEEAELSTVSDAATVSGTITISAPETLLSYRLPAMLKAFQAAHPAVRFTLASNSSCVPRDRIDPAVDVVFTMDEPIVSDQLEVVQLFEEPVALVAATDHPDEIGNWQFLVTHVNCSYRRAFESQLRRSGKRMAKFLEFDSVEAIKHCAMLNMGVAVLPEVVVRSEIRAGQLRIVTWPERPLSVFVQMLRHRDKWKSPAVQEFWRLAELALSNCPQSVNSTLFRSE